MAGKTISLVTIMNKYIIIALILLAFGLIFGYFVGTNLKQEQSDVVQDTTITETISKENCLSDQCLVEDIDFPVGELSDEIKQSLLSGLDDEYKAYATYRSVMDTYGNIRPFVMIARAEQQHIVALQGLFEKYGLTIPDNLHLDNIDVPGSIQDACRQGVVAEIANVRLYKEDLLPLVNDYPDITQVYTNLMNASEQKHLPAFERCD